MKTIIAGVAVVVFSLLLVGCGGGGNNTGGGGSSNPNAVPDAAAIVGPWQIQATSTINPGLAVLIETNLSETSSETLTSSGFVVISAQVNGNQLHITGTGDECQQAGTAIESSGSINVMQESGETQFTMTETGQNGSVTATGTITFSSDGKSVISGTFNLPAGCGFPADAGTLSGSRVVVPSGTYSGTLTTGNVASTMILTLTANQNYQMTGTGTLDGAPISLTGTIIGSAFNATVTEGGTTTTIYALYNTTGNDFLVFDEYLNFLGQLSAGSNPPTQATPTLVWAKGTVGIGTDTADHGNPYYPTFPESSLAGNAVVIGMTFPNSINVSSVTDDKGNTYSLATSCANTGLYTPDKHAIYVALNVAAGATHAIVTFSAGSSNIHFALASFYNVAASSAPDGSICTTDIVPTSNTAPNIQAGSFSTTTDGDLIWNYVSDEADGIPGDNNSVSSITYGTGFTGLHGEQRHGSATQFEIQAAHGAINPGITFSQTTHDSFGSVAIALKASAITQGSGPGPGIHILREETLAQIDTSTPFTFPCSGNEIVVVNETGGTSNLLTAVSDTQSNTYTQISGTNTTSDPNIFYTTSATCANNLSGTLTLASGAGGTTLVVLFDLTGVNASSPIDTGVRAANSSTLTATESGATKNAGSVSGNANITDAPSLTPSVAGDLIIGAINLGTGPPSGVVTGVYDLTWYAGSGDSNYFNNGDGVFHYLASSTSTVNVQYTVSNSGTTASWNALAAAFRPGIGLQAGIVGPSLVAAGPSASPGVVRGIP
jgi:hypothetical protein